MVGKIRLRTLKDIFPPGASIFLGDMEEDSDMSFIRKDILRDAAMEWIKELNNGPIGGYQIKQGEFKDAVFDSLPIIDWIKHFFNLEE